MEDDDAIRVLIQDLLENAGYAVSTARTGTEGLERVGEARPDVILLDKLMPQGDGTLFAREYRRRPGPHAPIVALCASHDAEEWSRSIDAAAIVVKPFDIGHLLAAVSAQLRAAG